MRRRIFTAIGSIFGLVASALLSGCGNLTGELSRVLDEMEKSQTASVQPPRPITEADLASVPPVVRQYLEFSGVLGKVPVQRVRVKQEGRMKTDRKAGWRNFTSEEYYTVSPKSFAWLGTFPLIGPLSIQAIDKFIGGHGSLKVRLSPMFDMGTTTGPESDVSEFIRFFSEMTWFPTALLDRHIAWQDLGNRHVKATIKDEGLEASAIISFGEDGGLLSWATDDRFALIGGKMIRARWTTSGVLGDLLNVGGYKIPRGGAAIYSLPGGDFHYIDIHITEIEFDPPKLSYCF